MALSFTQFTSSYGAIAYTLLAVVITFSTMNYLYRSDRFIAAMTTLVLFVLIFTFFGLRWLSASRAEGTGPQGEWPPIINTCPDFLILMRHNTEDNVCIDITGVARQSSAQQGTSSFPSKFLKTHTEYRTQMSSLKTISEESNGKFNYFKSIYKPGMSKEAIQAIGREAMQFGLSWEGITTGHSLVEQVQSDVQVAAAAASSSTCAPPPGCPAPAPATA